jgi:hypothetical protein
VLCVSSAACMARNVFGTLPDYFATHGCSSHEGSPSHQWVAQYGSLAEESQVSSSFLSEISAQQKWKQDNKQPAEDLWSTLSCYLTQRYWGSRKLPASMNVRLVHRPASLLSLFASSAAYCVDARRLHYRLVNAPSPTQPHARSRLTMPTPTSIALAMEK